MFNKLNNYLKIRTDEHSFEVMTKSFTSSVVKVVGMMISMIVSITLGRILGAEGLGSISLIQKVTSLLLVFILFGMQNVLIKEIAIANNKKNWKRIRNCMTNSYVFNGAISLIIVVLFVFLSDWLSKSLFKEESLKYPLIIGLLALVPMTFTRIFSSGMIGFKKIWQSSLINDTLTIFIVALFLLIAHFANFNINILNVVICYSISRLLISFSVGVYWNNIYKSSGKIKNIMPELLVSALPLLGVSFSGVLFANADGIILGWLTNTKEVGLYSVAARLAMLTSFFLFISNSAIAPKIAALYSDGKIKELEKMLQQVTKILFLIGSFALFIYVFFGNVILSLWGEEFKEGYLLLIIISIGQFVNISTGAVGMVLIMTGYEKLQSRITLSFVLVNLISHFILIEYFGSLGAAIANAITLIGLNVLQYIYVYKTLGINVINSIIKQRE